MKKKNEVHQNNKVFRIYKKKKIENEHIAINTFNTLRNKKLFKFLKKTNKLFRVTGGDAYNYCLFCFWSVGLSGRGEARMCVSTRPHKVAHYGLIPGVLGDSSRHIPLRGWTPGSRAVWRGDRAIGASCQAEDKVDGRSTSAVPFRLSSKKRDLPIGSLIQRRATPSGGGRPHDAAPRGSVSSARARLSI